MLGALGSGVAIGTLVFFIMKAIKTKNEKVLKMLESYLNKLTQLSESCNGFFEAVKEVYDKLSTHDLATPMELKDLAKVISFTDSSLQTIKEFQTRRSQREFTISEIDNQIVAIKK